MSTETLERSFGVAKQVLANVKPDQLDLPTPCKSWDVRALINHLVGGSFFFAAATEAGEAPEGGDAVDFASGDFAASYEDGTSQALAAFGAPGALEKTLKLPFGEFPGAAFMGIATVDTFTHAWDLAKATGQSTDLDPDLAVRLLEQSKGFMSEGFRGDEPLPFGPEQTPAQAHARPTSWPRSSVEALPERTATPGEERFWELAEPLLAEAGVTRSTMMGFPCLRVGGAFFACCDRRSGDLVVKVAAERVDALIDAGQGQPFAPAGKRFREWVAIPYAKRRTWPGHLDDALAFVTGSISTA